MRILLPMISLLTRAIVGSVEIHGSTLPSALQPRNDSSDVVTTDNRAEMPSMDASKMWKRHSFREKRSRMAIDSRYVWSDDPKEGKNFANGANVDPVVHDRGTDSTVKVLSKATENIGSRFDDKGPAKEKVSASQIYSWKVTYKLVPKQNLIRATSDSMKLTTVPKESPTPYEGEKNPRFYWWGGKRLSSYEPSVANIRRPIRVSFNSWGGKRGREYPRSNVNTQMKRRKLAFDRIDQGMSMDGLDGVKRTAAMGKTEWTTPFNSWGGKRTDKPIGWEEFLFSPEETKILDNTKGFIDGKNGGKNGGEAHVVSLMNAVSGVYESLKEKCETIPYTILFRVCNETMRPNYMTEDEDRDTNYWPASMPKKITEQHGQYKKTKFNPWGGKRSLKTYASRYGKEYFAAPAHSEQYPKGFASFRWI